MLDGLARELKQAQVGDMASVGAIIRWVVMKYEQDIRDMVRGEVERANGERAKAIKALEDELGELKGDR